MAIRLNFQVWVQGQNRAGSDNISTSRYIWVQLMNNAGNISGTPEVRLGAGGTWVAADLVTPNKFTNLAAGSYEVYYRDARGTRLLFTAEVLPYAGSCFEAVDPDAYVPPLVLRVSDSAIYITQSFNYGDGVYPYTYSLDGVTYQGSNFPAPAAYGTTKDFYRKSALACVEALLTDLLITDIPALDASYIKTDVSTLGGSDGAIDVTPSGGTGIYTYAWADGPTTQDRTGLTVGVYTVIVSSGGDTRTLIIDLTEPAELAAEYVATNETAPALDDGTIAVTASGGSGEYSIEWLDGPSTSFTRTGLAAGSYTAIITDDNTLESVQLEIVITEPVIVIPYGDFLQFPLIQSLRWVNANPTGRPNFDNRLFCKYEYYKHWRKSYYQRVEKAEYALPVMFYSNYPAHTVELFSLTSGALVKSFQAEKTLQLTGVEQTYGIFITADPDQASQSRVYFNSGVLPDLIELGDVFEILNSGDGYNGNYEIVGIVNDTVLGAQYLLINKPYVSGDPSLTADATFTTSVVNYDVFEVALALGDVADGYYYLLIKAINPDETYAAFTTEPVWLKTAHSDCNLVEFRNADNAFGVVYSTGMTTRLWVESQFYKVLGGGQDENYRESNYSPVKLVGKAARKALFETFNLPGYLHDKLNVGFRHDYVAINGVQQHADEAYGEPNWRPRYPLANSSIVVEQVNLFTDWNGDDLGLVESTGYIKANGGYLKR
jgi:hypothetical protein